MSRSREAGIVTLPNDALGNPRPQVETTSGETWVLTGMITKGNIGVTTRDFLGADLRHYIREFKRKGIGVRDEWETDAFGRHKRWWLKDGYSIERIPKKKTAPRRSERLSNPASQDGNLGGLSDEA